MSEKSCSTCLYFIDNDCDKSHCSLYSGWRPKDNKPITFVDKAVPNGERSVMPYGVTTGDGGGGFVDDDEPLIPPEDDFSLDKLIDDHWSYISNLIDVTQMHSNPKEKAIAEFHYKTAAVHFWKHCKEHYNIEGESNE